MNRAINAINRANVSTLSLSIGKSSSFIDDIDVVEWLNEIDLLMYENTFRMNITINGNHQYLSRKKLAQIKIHHLSNMNITNFAHQKIIMEHIQHTLQYPFQSPVRRREVEAKHSSVKSPVLKYSDSDVSLDKDKNHNKGAHRGNKNLNDLLKGDHRKQPAPGRRRSFDHNVWNSITTMRDTDTTAVDALREGLLGDITKKKTESNQRRRRRSFDENDTSNPSNKGTLFGNRALEFDIMLKELKLLQDNHLEKYKQLIKCEKATIIFTHEKSRELVEFSDGQWYRLPAGVGIAGYCAETGETVSVQDAYHDLRFNKNFDLKTGFKTKTVLCQPLRSHRGGGHIIGVIEMTNKIGSDHFDEHDAELLSVCVQRISDELNARFKDLLHAAEMFSGNALFVGERGGGNYSPSAKPIWEKPTHASVSMRFEPDRSERM